MDINREITDEEYIKYFRKIRKLEKHPCLLIEYFFETKIKWYRKPIVFAWFKIYAFINKIRNKYT